MKSILQSKTWKDIEKGVEELKKLVDYQEHQRLNCWCSKCENPLKCQHDDDLPHEKSLCGECTGEGYQVNGDGEKELIDKEKNTTEPY